MVFFYRQKIFVALELTPDDMVKKERSQRKEFEVIARKAVMLGGLAYAFKPFIDKDH